MSMKKIAAGILALSLAMGVCLFVPTGEGGTPLSMSVSAAENKPAAPTGVKISKKTASAVTVTWNKVKGAKGYVVTAYDYEDGFSYAWTEVTGTKAVLKGLAAGGKYKITVRVSEDESGRVFGKESKAAAVTLPKSKVTLKTASDFTYTEFELEESNTTGGFVQKNPDKVPAKLMKAAKKTLKTVDRYKNITKEPERFTENVLNDYLSDGKPEPLVIGAVYRDLDGDGKKEAFIMFDLPFYNGDVPYNGGDKDILVYVNSKGEAEIVYESYAHIAGIIEYDGFSHVVTEGFYNRSSLSTAVFSVKDGKPVQEYHNEWTSIVSGENNCIYQNRDMLAVIKDGWVWDGKNECYVKIRLPESKWRDS